MKFQKIYSYAKINLSLNIIKKIRKNFHKIESLVTFAKLYDEILIKPINLERNKIIFTGRFSKQIGKNNSIFNTFKILEKKNLLKGKKFEIRIKKNIPQRSGMGGGSMNAASVINYLIKKKKMKISKLKLLEVCKSIGSDVVLGLEKKNTILLGNGSVIRSDAKIKLYILIAKPSVGCSTKIIYKNVNRFSKAIYSKNNKNFFKINNLTKYSNDLEKSTFKIKPEVRNLNNFFLTLPNLIFCRMTGSGSSIVGYFKTKKASIDAAKLLKNKYSNYWYILSKTI
tara:strand:- start:69 stop:917 length:849 start_codon:yes stop_codon:yes gene_type:complete